MLPPLPRGPPPPPGFTSWPLRATVASMRNDARRISYNLAEAAEVTGMSRDLLYRAVKSGDLPAKRTARDKLTGEPAGNIIVLHSALVKFIEELPDDWWGHKYR